MRKHPLICQTESYTFDGTRRGVGLLDLQENIMELKALVLHHS